MKSGNGGFMDTHLVEVMKLAQGQTGGQELRVLELQDNDIDDEGAEALAHSAGARPLGGTLEGWLFRDHPIIRGS